MKKSFEQSQSVWMDTAEVRLESSLVEKVSADVCIVGAGIAGMSTAYLVAREGKSVVVVDDGPIGGMISLTSSFSAGTTDSSSQRFRGCLRSAEE